MNTFSAMNVFLCAAAPLQLIAAAVHRLRAHRCRGALLLTLAGTTLAATAAAEGPAEEPIQPDRPGIADGSTVVGPRRFQIEVGVQRQERTSGRLDQQMLFTPTLLRYGFDERWEARIETNAFTHMRSSEPGAGVGQTSGYSPVSIGGKYHFREARESTGNLSLGVILRMFPPSGSSDFRIHHLTSDLRLAADWNLAPDWALNPNLGVALYEDDAGKIFTAGLIALTLTYAPSKRLQPFLDVGVQSPEETAGRTAVIFDGGATYLLDPSTQIDFGIGPGLTGRTTPDLFWTIGVSRRFGPSGGRKQATP